MKTFRFLSMLLAAFTFWSCSGSGSEEIPEPVPNPTPEKPEVYTVSLNLGGEYISTSESPMSRGDNSTRVYGINVYYKDDNSTSWERYASGLFDDTNNMIISLIASYKYKFVCTITEDNKDNVYYYTGDDGRYYYYPFKVLTNNGYNTHANMKNKFVANTNLNSYLLFIDGGKTTVGNSDTNKDYPRVDRFYGELSDFVPSENSTPTIEMKRTAFGIKVVAKAPSDGTLILSNEKIGNIATINSEDGDYESETIITFKDVYKCWAGTTTEQEFTFKLTWKRKNGTKQEFTKKVTVKRNVMTTLNIDVTSTTADSGVKLNIDDTPMETETVNWSIEA